MATVEDLVGGLEKSRAYFLRHLKGMPAEAWGWKPYPECKSLLETLAHMRNDDMGALESIKTGKEPDYEGLDRICNLEMVHGPDHLLRLLSESHAELLGYIRSEFGDKPFDATINIWGTDRPLHVGIPYLSSEDFYHAGQAAFIRMAVEPGWDYYAAIYGESDGNHAELLQNPP